jgi:hypothetical protein
VRQRKRWSEMERRDGKRWRERDGKRWRDIAKNAAL